jgi:polysaccharide deacetylase 2 family uncharacterized protein YibQ
MARKRKRSRRLNPALLVIVALLLAAVVWAILPRGAQRIAHRHHAAAPIAQATAPPEVTPTPAAAVPAPSPTTFVAAEPTESPEPGESAQASNSPAPAEVSANPTAPKVALIIDDCGQWIDTERALIALPIPITLSVLPHVHYTTTIAQEAADAGKGVMLHLPMEPISHAYPGPGEIKTEMPDDAIVKQMEDDLAQVPLAKGVNNHEGSEASADDRVMKDVMSVIKQHDLFFVDSRTNSKTVGSAEATDDGVPTASRDVFLDNRADVAYTESMLDRTIAIAKRNGSAIAIGHPKLTTLAAIREMYPKMEGEGVQFVLVQQLVR